MEKSLEKEFKHFESLVIAKTKDMLNEGGEVNPHLLMVNLKKKMLALMPLNFPKHVWHDAVVFAVKETKADFYAHVSEAWCVAKRGKKEAGVPELKVAPSKHPDRKEVLIFSFYARDRYEMIGIQFERKDDKIVFGEEIRTSDAVDNIIGDVFGEVGEKTREEIDRFKDYVI